MIYIVLLLVLLFLVLVYDLTQKKHAILRNFPVIGHLRYWLEAVGPELRQYIVTNNDEERPFSRDQRRWIYASSKSQNEYFGFGTDNDLEGSSAYLVIQHKTLAAPDVELRSRQEAAGFPLPCAKVLGQARGRAKAFRPPSLLNVSAMSFGSLSAAATEAMNRGCAEAGALHNTGEGGIAPYHLHGGELIWQIGTGYFGCRDERGRFDIERFTDTALSNPVRAIEIKLSQGAKPGLGGILPAAKISPEIAAIRGIPMGVDCVSPPGHSAFTGVDGLLDFVEELAERTGLPVGIKSAVGESAFWGELARAMESGTRGIDFLTIDGGEGGTGAGPLAFTDHVALPFKIGFTRVYRTMAEHGLHERLVFAGSGKLGFPERALMALALGCDLVSLAREPMLSLGCIQAQRCHTGHCPTGVATQNRWLERGLDRISKAERLAAYFHSLRRELQHLSHACGKEHPALVSADQLELLNDSFGSRTLATVFGYEEGWGLPSARDREALLEHIAGAQSSSR